MTTDFPRRRDLLRFTLSQAAPQGVMDTGYLGTLQISRSKNSPFLLSGYGRRPPLA
jgi:hypothetical protein